MYNENVLQKSEKLLEECRPKEALQYLEQSHMESTKEYFHLKAKILVALSRYREALKMYTNGVIACKSNEEAIDFKSQTHQERIDLERKSKVYYKEVNFAYDTENALAFLDNETYEIIEVDKKIAKYITYNLEEGKTYILVIDIFGKQPLNLVEKDEALEIEFMTRIYD